ncbi:Uncharacterised protein [Burkholderia pseudomallei]|nr:Uncharacterised protein [Burkholderia pseudomallei]
MRARAHRPRPRAGRPRSSAARRQALRRRRTPDAAACGSRRACARESIRSKRSRVRPGALCFVSFCSCLASGIRHPAFGIRHPAFGTRRRMTCDVQRRARSRRALPHARAPDWQASSGRPRMHARRIEAAAGSARHGRTRGAAPPSGARAAAPAVRRGSRSRRLRARRPGRTVASSGARLRSRDVVLLDRVADRKPTSPCDIKTLPLRPQRILTVSATIGGASTAARRRACARPPAAARGGARRRAGFRCRTAC